MNIEGDMANLNLEDILKDILYKLDRLEKKVDKNSADITDIYKQINMGRGGVKVLSWVGAIIVAILGWRMSQ
tara:strand:- start:78 stop:293 length:216 start_codon:yes stop_codon:yes gene_type:complete